MPAAVESTLLTRPSGPPSGADASRAAVVVLPPLEASAAAQMAIDAGLLHDARRVTARLYLWTPAAVSVGKFQVVPGGAQAALAAAGLPLVRRPSGGRAVLHGAGFEWSFAVAFPADALAFGPEAPYRLVNEAFAAALSEAGVALDAARSAPYERSSLCFSSPLRHDLLAGGDKVVAVAQARRGGRVLVHGSVLERRPPLPLVAALEQAFGEPWCGAGLAAAGMTAGRDALWRAVVARVGVALARVGIAGEQSTATMEVRE